MTDRLVNWTALPLHISGEKAAQMIGRVVEARKAPISSLFLEFRDGELVIEGKATKGMTVPFEVKVREIRGEGSILHVAKKAPPFVDLTFGEVRLVKGGVEITLGPGGADLPERPPRES